MERQLNSPLFDRMTGEEIQLCQECSGAKNRIFEKNSIIFSQLDKPAYIYVMIEGSVAVCKDSLSGRRSIITTIENAGDVFGEVYLFLNQPTYDYYTITLKRTTVLEIPKEFFYQTCQNSCEYHSKLIRNMLGILAQKAFSLSQKVQLLSGGTLRQKIGRYLLEQYSGKETVLLTMNREEFAHFLNVARPSLSRELLKMQEDGLILLRGREIKILDFQALEEL